jgi:hypothetical protein
MLTDDQLKRWEAEYKEINKKSQPLKLTRLKYLVLRINEHFKLSLSKRK